MSLPTLTLEQARLVNLAAQGLLTPPAQFASKSDVLTAIRCMGMLQIDTIHVVARSPYFVLFSRLGDYDPVWLEELLIEKSLFEQWAHAACFIPMEDYPLIRRLILEGHHNSYFGDWADKNRDLVNHILEVVRGEGPKRSADFKSEKDPGGWWNWKLEKIALEYWLARGELMVSRREKFQRVYDLRERVLLDWDDAIAPPLDVVYRQLILNSVRALGIARPAWIPDYYRLKKKEIPAVLVRLVEMGELCEARVEGWAEPVLFTPESEPLIMDAKAGKLRASHTTLLSPFDPLIWDRNRVRQLFNFDFMIQAYTPAAKRQYGYFPLPILHNGLLVGRLDAKAHRKEGVFEVKTLFLESDVQPSEELSLSLTCAIKQCALWHKTPSVKISQCLPNAFLPLLAHSLEQAG